MSTSVRFGIVGLVALAGLSAIHWARDEGIRGGPLDALLGFGPNLFASLAITFVGLSVWAQHRERRNLPANGKTARVAFAGAAAVSGLGLIGWEFVQRMSARFVFDGADIAATIAGLFLGALIFRAVAGKP